MFDPNVESFRKRIYSHMLETRGPKYKWFLRALRMFKFASMSPTRGTFLESYYLLMRYVDDVVDGDTPLPVGYSSSEDFVSEKISFMYNQQNPRDEVDHVMLYCFKLGKQFGEDFTEETDDILSSILFDAKRRGKREIFPKDILEHHFHILDVKGTISATLKVFGEDVEKYLLLQPLGLATRIHYNLRDYDEDVQAGLFNIPSEDCKRLGIENLEDRLSLGVQNWFKDQAARGMQLLEQHRQIIVGSNLGWLSRITLPLVYEKPARRFFEQVLN